MSSPFGFGAVLPARAALWSRATSARLQVRWGKTSAAERIDLGAVCNPALIDAWLFVFYRCYNCNGFGLGVYGQRFHGWGIAAVSATVLFASPVSTPGFRTT